MKVIAFCGNKRSGKSTATTFLKALLADRKVVELAFADKLKEICATISNLDINNFHDQKLKEKQLRVPITITEDIIKQVFAFFKIDKEIKYDIHIRPFVNKTLQTPRDIMVFIGTDILHNIDADVHIKGVLAQITDPDTVYVISDLRFKKEFEALNDAYGDNFKSFYIKNTSAEEEAKVFGTRSELELHSFKFLCNRVIINNTTLADLNYQIIDASKTI